MSYDVVIVGGGPAGLSAALALGRARRRVLLCDAGPRRNAAAAHVNNFVTRDGTPPAELRAIGADQLRRYPSVELRAVGVAAIAGERDAFRVTLDDGVVEARRVLICTGMVDQMLAIDGFRALWGASIFQCPYCHGWEVQDQRWGYLASARDAAHVLPFSLMVRAWTDDVVVFTNGEVDLPADVRDRLVAAGIRIETAPVTRLVERGGALATIELADGTAVPRDVLFTHPPQRQVELVRGLGLALDEHGFVAVDPMRGETSIPGIHAAGDLTTRMQGAIHAAAAGARVAGAINADVMMSRA